MKFLGNHMLFKAIQHDFSEITILQKYLHDWQKICFLFVFSRDFA